MIAKHLPSQSTLIDVLDAGFTFLELLVKRRWWNLRRPTQLTQPTKDTSKKKQVYIDTVFDIASANIIIIIIIIIPMNATANDNGSQKEERKKERKKVGIIDSTDDD